jgi:hypothetical protein
MTGSEFAALYGTKGLPAWEAAVVALARSGGLTPWPWVPVTVEGVLADGRKHSATLQVRSDVMSVGPLGGDVLRLPLTPRAAQNVANVDGSLLPTPWLDYLIWRASPAKLAPIQMPPSATMKAYVTHSRAVDQELSAASVRPGTLTSGHKKDVVVSNLYKPGKVLIHGWYNVRLPDVFDDGQPWDTQSPRQPRQVRSNVHGDFYVDYSHGIRLVGPQAVVDGQPMATADLYRHPLLAALVSNEDPYGRIAAPGSPLRVIRYPADVSPPSGPLPVGGVASTSAPVPQPFVRTTPGTADLGLERVQEILTGGSPVG